MNCVNVGSRLSPLTNFIQGGLRFYDRIEIKTILDYLRVIAQPDNNDALARVINTPSRRIGEATIKGLLEEADQSKMTLWTLVLNAAQGKRTPKMKINKNVEKGIIEFVSIILTARSKITDSEGSAARIVELINHICKKTNYESWLKEHHADVHGARWDNVQELITQARDFQATAVEDDSLPEIDGVEQNEESDHLSRFLANVALASEVKEEEDENTPACQVTISTIHAAKGLEWPVVFIPALYEGSIPHSRSEDTDEERRLLYVAMTRAKTLLYMSVPLKSSQGDQTVLSQFLSQVSLAPLLDQQGPSFPSSTIQSIAQTLRRQLPSPQSLTEAAVRLPSAEDDLYPIDGEEAHFDEGSSYSTKQDTSYTYGQMPAKRRRIEFGRSASDTVQDYGTKPGFTSTVSLYRSSSTTEHLVHKTNFISGGSLLTVNAQAVNRTLGVDSAKDAGDDSKLKTAGSQKNNSQDGQGTLHGFFTRADPRPRKEPIPVTSRAEPSKAPKSVPGSFLAARRLPEPDTSSSGTKLPSDLANHRLGTGKSTRPKPVPHVEEHARKDYVFLSSSPPRPNSPAEKPATTLEQPPGQSTRPPLMPSVRPAACMHTTTVANLQGGGPRKTLGIKRSMNGWPSQKGTGFVPPTIKRSG